MVTFVRKATKKSLLTMLRKAEKITPRLLAKLFEGVLFKDEFETFSAGGGTDHGSLGGLSDDDHPQYPLETDVDYALVSGNDAATNVTAAELEELSDGSTTSLHSHADDCPEYKYIKALAQSEGDLHLSDGTNWNTSLALIKSINISTLSTDWDGWILRNDNGYVLDDATIPATQIMDAGSGDYVIEFDLPYEDEDASGEVHLHLIDNSGSNTFDVYVLGYGLK